MSFSGDVKKEIVRRMPEEPHCLLAEIAAIICFAGKICREQGGESVLVETENVGLAKKYLRMVKQAFGIQVDLNIRRRPSGRNRLYTILITEQAGRVIRRAADWEDAAFARALLKKNCCKRAFIRGAFLAAGSMSDPGKSYHFEIVCRDRTTAERLREAIRAFEIDAKTVIRKKKHIVYLKDSAEIVDILNVMTAHQSLMELENIRIIKDMRNSANRQYNCDSANINKMVRAASRQLEDIRLIEQYGGLEQLPPALREMAQVRLEYPDVSLQELGNYLDPPIGKSGVNHRLRKLGEIAGELKADREE